MSRHEDRHPTSSNLFVDLNGVPYILAEYLDRTCIQQIDRSIIRSDIFVDEHEAMRAVIDVNIDDIGRKFSNRRPAVIGNTTKNRQLIDMIEKNAHILDHQLSVLRRGIVVRVEYDVENYRTHQVLRTMTEDLRLTNRNYFLEINPIDINDNAVITNFTDTCVSTVNDFTHGRDRMLFRITGIKMFYEKVQTNPMKPKHHREPVHHNYIPDITFDGRMNEYDFHKEMQHELVIGELRDHRHEQIEAISPPQWTDFNRFYHFDNGGKDLILHDQEIYDSFTEKILIPCGKVKLNRAFIINPGHRIIFKISIWKNDVTVVPNTQLVAQALKAPVYGFIDPNFFMDHHGGYHEDYHHKEKVDKDQFDLAMKLLAESRGHEKEQDKTIKSLMKAVQELQAKIDGYHPEEDNQPEPEEEPKDGCGCDCDCDDLETMTRSDVVDMFQDVKSEITIEDETVGDDLHVDHSDEEYLNQ